MSLMTTTAAAGADSTTAVQILIAGDSPTEKSGILTTETAFQFARYVVVGGTALLVDFAILVLATDVLHVHYLISAALGFLGGLAVNYSLSVRWVFDQRRVQSAALEFQWFVGIGIVGLGLSELLMWTGTSMIGLPYAGSKLVAAALVFLWNFSARKFFLFT